MDWEGFYSECWAILVQHAGAKDSSRHRMDFVLSMLDGKGSWDCSEYRFCGTLGFGGKFRRGTLDDVHITCYPEDSTPERQATVQKVNDLLKELQARMVGGPIYGSPERHQRYLDRLKK